MRELHLHVRVVTPDHTTTTSLLAALPGRELPGAPGTWIAAADLAEGEEWDDIEAAEADADDGHA